MEKNSISNTLSSLIDPFQDRHPSKYWDLLRPFLQDYEAILVKKKIPVETHRALIQTYCELVFEQLSNPRIFEPFHKSIRSPVDYYRVGIEIFRNLIDVSRSKVLGLENVAKINSYVEAGENVILYANHQIEADPQAICLLLEKEFPKLVESMIVVAGERVVTDPLAVPFSAGLNLICIYSKKYFDVYPEKRTQMQEHNKVSMLTLGQLLNQGGKCIYIAPSGGRDRKNASGVLEVAKFDPQSIELLYLLGRKAKSPTHFFPLALSTHDILPPPEGLQVALGESRATKEAPASLFFGKEIDMEHVPHADPHDKQKKKELRAESIWELVKEQYAAL